jgi:hypothetical protein
MASTSTRNCCSSPRCSTTSRSPPRSTATPCRSRRPGGHLARVFTTGLGRPAERRDRAAEIIVLHMRDDVDPAADPESRLLQIGTTADVSGGGLEGFDPGFVRELLAAHPRFGFADRFVGLFRDQAARKPDCAAARLVAGGWPDRTLANPLEKA